MILNLKETVESLEHGVTLPESHMWDRRGAEACLWTVRPIFLHYCWCCPLPVESTLPPHFPLTPVRTQEVWMEPIGLEWVRPMGRKLNIS